MSTADKGTADRVVIVAPHPPSIDFYEVSQSVGIMMCLIQPVNKAASGTSAVGQAFCWLLGDGEDTNMDSLEMSGYS